MLRIAQLLETVDGCHELPHHPQTHDLVDDNTEFGVVIRSAKIETMLVRSTSSMYFAPPITCRERLVTWVRYVSTLRIHMKLKAMKVRTVLAAGAVNVVDISDDGDLNVRSLAEDTSSTVGFRILHVKYFLQEDLYVHTDQIVSPATMLPAIDML